MTVDVKKLEDELLELGTATLYEASGIDCDLPASLRPAWPGSRIVGRALPIVTAAGDNLPLHWALERAQPGDVLVVDGQGAPHGYWGEVLTVFAQTQGVAGLIIDGGVRDIRQIEALGFPVFSSQIAIRGTVKRDGGSIGVPIRLGDALVRPGDVIVADADGIVSLPWPDVPEVLEFSRRRVSIETGHLARLRDGASTVDLYELPRP